MISMQRHVFTRSNSFRRNGMAGVAGAILFLLAFAGQSPASGSRVKDIAVIAGARDNQLTGYGLVVGLAGDGDKNPVQTLQTVGNVLQRFGLTVPAATISAKNVA